LLIQAVTVINKGSSGNQQKKKINAKAEPVYPTAATFFFSRAFFIEQIKEYVAHRMQSSQTTQTTMSDAPDFSGAAKADCVDSQRPCNLRLREKRPIVSQKMQMSGKKQRCSALLC
jgi:hypothetical protein